MALIVLNPCLKKVRRLLSFVAKNPRADRRRTAPIADQWRPAKLGARAFDVLLALVERRDRAVSQNEMFELVWPNVVVKKNLQVHISTLRKLLGPQAIATIPGRGYRFTAGLEARRRIGGR